MADIRINDLPLADGITAPSTSDNVAIDGPTTRRTTIGDIGNISVPVASQAEAEAGVNSTKRMTPLTTKQSIASQIGVTIASKQQGDIADVLSPLANGGSSGSLPVRTSRLNLPTSGGGSVYAFGRNGDNTGTNYNGIQIGGGLISDGPDGVFIAPDEHASWKRNMPSKNYSPIEELYYSTAASGVSSKINGTNRFLFVSGAAFDNTWIGEKFYWESEVYRISGISPTEITVTTLGGGAVVNSGSASGFYHVFYVEGVGVCNVSGTNVTRVSGDPFIPFFTSPFHMIINGSPVTVNGYTNNALISVTASLGTLNGVSYRWRTDIDDTMVQMRLQKIFGSTEENLTTGVKPWGYFLRTQIAGPGVYRPFWVGSGNDKSQLALMPDGKLRLGDHQKISTPNSDAYNYLEFDSAAGGSGFGPSFRTRGADANIGFTFDIKGLGDFSITNGTFGRTIGKFNSTGDGNSNVEFTSNNGVAEINVASSLTSADLRLAAKGTSGRLRMGAFTASADVPVVGYIEIKDLAGNIRKLAVIA